MFKLSFAKPVGGASFAELPRGAQLRFNEAFELLEERPRTPGPGLDIHQLSGYQNLWTLSIPPWRGIYALDGDQVVMIVFGHRENIYPKLHGLLAPEGRYVAGASLGPRRGRAGA
ncbi:MAG: type II toxin-antitoxin system RelE family toxin [Thermoplasmata archaeon]